MLENKFITPEGTKDYLFEEAIARKAVENNLRAIYERHHFFEVVTPSLEFIDVVNATGHGMNTEDMYQLFDHKGRAMVMRPDSTMPIARLAATRLRSQPLPLRLYYNQAVYSTTRSMNGHSDEIMQTGIELMGESEISADIEVVSIAMEALNSCDKDNIRLEIGHIGIFNSLINALHIDDSVKERIRILIEAKNYPALNDLLDSVGSGDEISVMKQLPRLFGGKEVFSRARKLISDPSTIQILAYLEQLYNSLHAVSNSVTVDLGIVNRVDYYTGIVFKGYIEGSGEAVLSGGRYDDLLARFGRDIPAIGFAINVDAVVKASFQKEMPLVERPLRIALTKGRLEKDTVNLFVNLGFDCEQLHNKGRKLILQIPDQNLEVVLAKAADVITYIENGVCDIGVVGKDTIMEYGGSFFEVTDLGFGKCRFAVAAKKNTDFYSGHNEKTIATKYPNVARDFFKQKGMDVRIVKIEGSVELAPLLELSDAIVDIVETGSTLNENGLVVVEDVAPISARLIVNTVSLKLHQSRIEELVEKIEQELIDNTKT